MTAPTPPRDALPYGPETPAVRAFLRALSERPVADWVDATRTYRDLLGSARFRVADQALAAAVEQTIRERARDAVVGPVLQMAGRAAAGAEGGGVSADDLAEAALAAALALLVRDVLPPRAAGTLLAPFAALGMVEG